MNSVAHLPRRTQIEFHRRRQCVSYFNWLRRNGELFMAASEKARARYVSDGGRQISEKSLRRWVLDGFFTFHGPRQAVRISFTDASPARP